MSAPKRLGKGHNDKLRGVTTIKVERLGADPVHHARVATAEAVLRLTGDTEPLTPGWEPTDVQRAFRDGFLDALGLGSGCDMDLDRRPILSGRSSVEPVIAPNREPVLR